MTPLTSTGSPISDATDQTFMAEVIDASQSQPVLVDFWAPWCGPCKTLTPVLEKVVTAEAGKIKLVKINIDENPGVAGQMGVRSIPAVFAFDKGRPVNAFQGALPEGQIRQFVDQVLGGTDSAKQIEQAVEDADAKLRAGDPGGAAQIYGAVIEADRSHTGAIAGLARCYLANGDAERAKQVLDMVPEDKANDAAIKSVRTAIEMMAEAPEDTEVEAARAALAADPDDPSRRLALAEKLMANGDLAGASSELLEILRIDLEALEGQAKAKLLEIFEAAGPKDPVTVEGRRRLGSLMFS